LVVRLNDLSGYNQISK